MKTNYLVILFFALIVQTSFASNEQKWFTEKTLKTESGTFELQSDEDVFPSKRIVLNGKVLQSFGSRSIYIEYLDDDVRAKLIVIEISSGGSSCPAEYILIDFTINPVFVSKQFGTCSDIPTIALNNGILQLKFPSYIDTDGYEFYSYKIGSGEGVQNSVSAE